MTNGPPARLDNYPTSIGVDGNRQLLESRCNAKITVMRDTMDVFEENGKFLSSEFIVIFVLPCRLRLSFVSFMFWSFVSKICVADFVPR